MKVGLIDVDGHGFPNLALMRISAWHKKQGDIVEWWESDLFEYDLVYMSKVFSNEYSADVPEPANAKKVIKGGTGYCISLVDGKEVFDESKNWKLPAEIEHMFPDYSIYPECNFAISMTSRGCPRGCPFCISSKKDGRCSIKVADVSDFWAGQKEIKVLDPNIIACREKRDLLRQYRETGAWIDFNQGLDIRLINDADIEDINAMKIKSLHFAWDNPADDLKDKFIDVGKKLKIQNYRQRIVYVLVNYNSTLEADLFRVYTLRDAGYDPYIMVYNKNYAPKIIKQLQRYVNNKYVFKTIKSFDEYKVTRHEKDAMQIELEF